MTLVPMGTIAATLGLVGTKDMKVASMTVNTEDMNRNMNGPETMAAEAKVVMTTTQEKIAETVMTTEMKHAHLM